LPAKRLPFKEGITYSALCKVRSALYEDEGPELVAGVLENIEGLSGPEGLIHLEELNTRAMRLSALNPLWAPLSIAAFSNFMVAVFCGAITIGNDIREAFDSCAQRLIENSRQEVRRVSL